MANLLGKMAFKNVVLRHPHIKWSTMWTLISVMIYRHIQLAPRLNGFGVWHHIQRFIEIVPAVPNPKLLGDTGFTSKDSNYLESIAIA